MTSNDLNRFEYNLECAANSLQFLYFSILQKYNEEIEGLKREAFALSGEGTFDVVECKQQSERIKQRLQEGC